MPRWGKKPRRGLSLREATTQKNYNDEVKAVMMNGYILEDGKPVLVDLRSPKALAFWKDKKNLQVAREKVGDVHVSTVFLITDHEPWLVSMDPVVFETMCFGPDGSAGFMQRYCHLDEAKAGHRDVVRRLRDGALTWDGEEPERGL